MSGRTYEHWRFSVCRPGGAGGKNSTSFIQIFHLLFIYSQPESIFLLNFPRRSLKKHILG